MKPCLLLAALAAAAQAAAHGQPGLVNAVDGRLSLITDLPIGVLLDDGFEIATEDPGFGVFGPQLGPPTGTELGLETLGGLLYWDGSRVAPADATLVVEAPEFDSLGNANNGSVSEYTIAAHSVPQSGLLWSRYPGASFWDAHGVYLLTGHEGGDPATGLYGVPARLVDRTGRVDPSQPFVVSLRYGLEDTATLEAGLAALEESLSLLVAPPSGDYDGDGFVDDEDHLVWRSTYGASVPPGSGADGNGDGVVDAADYTVWRDALGGAAASSVTAATGSIAIPEPASALIGVVITFISALAFRA